MAENNSGSNIIFQETWDVRDGDHRRNIGDWVPQTRRFEYLGVLANEVGCQETPVTATHNCHPIQIQQR